MKKHTLLAVVLSVLIPATSTVCRAQDPGTGYRKIATLRAAGKPNDALKEVERMLKIFGNPESRLAQQFDYYAPFFLWQKGEILADMGEADKAFEVFKDLNTNKAYQDKGRIKRSKEEIKGYEQDGYAPFLSLAQLKMGEIRYMQGMGKEATEGKEAVPGDKQKFEEAIPLLEQYLKRFTSHKVTRTEVNQKFDGQIYFMLMQSYLLREKPNFKKVREYMEKGSNAKSAVSEEMSLNGLVRLMDVCKEKPEYIGWVGKLVNASPSGFRVSADRIARYAGTICAYTGSAVKILEDSLNEGNMDMACDAARTAYTLNGLIPDTEDVRTELAENIKLTGSFPGALPDPRMNRTLSSAACRKVLEEFDKMAEEHRELEAYGILILSGANSTLGSTRLGKAGYKVLIDRYPGLTKEENGESKGLKDACYMQYAQLCRAVGDPEEAAKYEGMVNQENLGDDGRNAMAVNRMERLVRDGQWEDVIKAADEVMRLFEADRTGQFYVTAVYCKLAAYYSLKQWGDVIKTGEEFLASGNIQVGEGKLTEEQARTYGTQTMFFVLESYRELAVQDPKSYDKAIETAERFMKTYPSLNKDDNPLAPNVYFSAINVLNRRKGHGNEAAAAKDRERALQYCEVIAKNWPESELYPTSRLIAGGILLNGQDDAAKPEGLVALEQCVDAGLKLPEGRGREVVSNALFWLANFSTEFPREGEDEAALKKRIAGYFDVFWERVDGEGNPYALQMAALQLSRSLDNRQDTDNRKQGKDGEKEEYEKEYEKALEKARAVIAREANYGLHNNRRDPELEPAINSYVAALVDGAKAFQNKDLTLEEKRQLILEFPGIAADDKYTKAILNMALLNSFTEAIAEARRTGDTKRVSELEREKSLSFLQMRNNFKPDEITDYICVQLGRFELDNAKGFRTGSAECTREARTATEYFNKVIERGGPDMRNQALVGKANALSLMGDANAQKEAYEIYNGLSQQAAPEVVAEALIGLTDLNLSMQRYDRAVDSADKYVRMRGVGTQGDRLKMQLKLGQAFAGNGDVTKGLQTYMNVFMQHRGAITYSAPAAKAAMELLWKRNNPSKGDRLKGNFTASDRWTAWNLGNSYVAQIRRAGIDKKMTAAERDLFNEVTLLVDSYAKDAAVQKEEKEKNKFQSQISG